MQEDYETMESKHLSRIFCLGHSCNKKEMIGRFLRMSDRAKPRKEFEQAFSSAFEKLLDLTGTFHKNQLS